MNRNRAIEILTAHVRLRDEQIDGDEVTYTEEDAADLLEIKRWLQDGARPGF